MDNKQEFLDTKNKSIKLRLEGHTYSEILNLLGRKVSKSTLSYWLKNIEMTNLQKRTLQNNIDAKLKKAQKAALKINKFRRKKYLADLKNKNLYLLKKLDCDCQKLILSMLYLGEGAKTKGTQFLSLGSSNPKIIKLYLVLLKNCFTIDRSKFRIRIQCRADQNIKVLENYWHNLTKISKKQFYPTYIDKRTIGSPTKMKEYKGVCTIHYFDRSIQFELELLSESVIKCLTEGL